MKIWFRHHISAICHALAQFRRTPGHFFFNILVLSMTLVLPFGGITLLNNIQSVANHLSVSPEISIFMKQNIDRAPAKELEVRIQKILKEAGQNAEIIFVAKETALDSLQEKTDLGNIAEVLGKNPLPDSYIIRLTGSMPSAAALSAQIESLRNQFKKLPGTDKIQIDSNWAKRLAALLGALRMGLFFLAVVLGIVVIVVTFNTVRLQVLMHFDEITLSWHVGATRAYIRRPFYYMGIFLGLFSGFVALILVNISLIPLNRAIHELVRLYGSDFQFSPLNPLLSAALLVGSAALGCLGALLSVNWQLRKIH